MKNRVIPALFLLASSLPATADSKPTDEEGRKITEALAAAGDSGGEIEKEDEGSGIYEIDDAKDKNGAQFDIQLDEDFRILSVIRD